MSMVAAYSIEHVTNPNPQFISNVIFGLILSIFIRKVGDVIRVKTYHRYLFKHVLNKSYFYPYQSDNKILNKDFYEDMTVDNPETRMTLVNVGAIRKELGFRTVFNILGPLSNPAGANMQVMGVYDENLVEPLARVLFNLGVKNAMVVYGQDCLDEISMSARTTVCEIKDGIFRSYEIEPEQFGFKKCSKEELVGGSPEENAKITLAILNGEKGPKREAVLMNAGAGFYVAGKVSTLEDGVKLAAELIDSGKAKERLDEFVKLSNQ